jgi:colanic acid/amylovoran biosynthesis glycosyltransferase
MSKSITFYVHRFPQLSETFIANQVFCAYQLGYKCSILAQKPSNENISLDQISVKESINDIKYSVLFPSNKVFRSLKAIYFIVFLGIPLKYLVRSLSTKYFGHKAKSLYYFYKVISFSKVRHSDIFHAQYGDNGTVLAVLKSIGFIHGKIITTFHGWDLHYNNSTFNNLKNEYKLLFKVGDIFTVNTPYSKDRLISLGCLPEKIEIVPMGTDSNFFLPPTIKETKSFIQLISVGRLIELKGHKFGIKVIKLLVDKGYKIKYIIVGDGECRNDLEMQVSQLNLSDNIYIAGVKSQLEIRNILQKSDIFLMTSVTDKDERKETQGLVTIEAQLCGIPVVAFDSGGVRYTLEDNHTGFLVDEEDVIQMAEKVILLINDKMLRERFAQNARNFALSNYSLDTMKEKLTKVYDLNY